MAAALQALRELHSEREAGAAARQIETLRKELEAIEDVDRADFEALRELGFSTDPSAVGERRSEERAVGRRDPAGVVVLRMPFQ